MSKIEEALKRGYNSGVEVRDLNTSMKVELSEYPDFKYYDGFNELWWGHALIFDGEWAEIIID